MARQIAQLILAAALAALAPLALGNDLRTPQTPWSGLSPDQQRILGPVAPDWERMPGYQQQRLMSAARQYPSLQPVQRERFEQRLRDWTSMTPDQRKAARETFQGLRKLPPEKQHELRERWLDRHQEYPAGRPQQGYSRERQQAYPVERSQGYSNERPERYEVGPSQPSYRDSDRDQGRRREESREPGPRGR